MDFYSSCSTGRGQVITGRGHVITQRELSKLLELTASSLFAEWLTMRKLKGSRAPGIVVM